MSNRLEIEVQTIVCRHDPNNPYDSIIVFDDYNTFDIYLGDDKAPFDPADLLRKVLLDAGKGTSEFLDLLSHHIHHSGGVIIEGDYIEWTDPRIAEVMKGWSDGEGYGFGIGDSVIVPDPHHEDGWNHSFSATVKGFKPDTDGTSLVTVEDQEGNCWDVELDRLKHNVD